MYNKDNCTNENYEPQEAKITWVNVRYQETNKMA